MSEEKPEQTFFLNEPSAKLSPKLSPKQPAAETDRAWRNAEQKSELPGGHYHGHRERMKERFQKVGHEGFADYEMLEMRLIVQSARATQSLSPRR